MNQPITMHIYIEWRLTQATKFKFEELIHHLDELIDEDPEYLGMVDQIRSLPGYPVNAPHDSDILLVVTDLMN
jgi:hypothetical protein